MNKISKHISYAEATKSSTAIRLGIDNTPNDEQLANMKLVAEEVFEPVRAFVGKPLSVNSFFRNEATNQAIGGSSRSQHCKGQAIDIDGDAYGVDNKLIFDFIRAEVLFDQLIWEFGTDKQPAWIHVSRVKDGNRRQVLQAKKIDGKTKYVPFGLY